MALSHHANVSNLKFTPHVFTPLGPFFLFKLASKMVLLQLSPELLLCIASHLDQIDLTNVARTCRRLQTLTESELYREYKNISSSNPSFLPFIKRIIHHPELARHVKKLSLRPWDGLDRFNPAWYGSSGLYSAKGKRELFERYRKPSITEADYVMLTNAAKHTRIITDILPYESTSYLFQYAKNILISDLRLGELWYNRAFDPILVYSELSYDRKFCQMLRAGVEDPLVVLLVGMLPNVREIHLQQVPCNRHALTWRSYHGSTKLRRLKACIDAPEASWPIAFFNQILARGKLETFEAEEASSWYREEGRQLEPIEHNAIPLSLRPGTLSLKRLDLRWCSLKMTDMKTLLRACHHLRALSLTIGGHGSVPFDRPLIGVMHLLEPLKHTLEELALNIDRDWMENDFDQGRDLIHSMKCMTALRNLRTPPVLWAKREHMVQQPKGRSPPMTSEDYLCFRLPPNLRALTLNLSESKEEFAIQQIQALIRVRAEVLPFLNHLYVGTWNDSYVDEVEQLLKELNESLNAKPQPLKVEIIRGGLGLAKSV